MVLRKITYDNSVRHIPKSDQPKQKSDKTNTIKNISNLRKQNENFSQNNKNFLKKFSAQRFKYLK